MTRIRTAGFAAGIPLGLLLAIPGQGVAATISIVDEPGSPHILKYVAAPGEQNAVTVSGATGPDIEGSGDIEPDPCEWPLYPVEEPCLPTVRVGETDAVGARAVTIADTGAEIMVDPSARDVCRLASDHVVICEHERGEAHANVYRPVQLGAGAELPPRANPLGQNRFYLGDGDDGATIQLSPGFYFSTGVVVYGEGGADVLRNRGPDTAGLVGGDGDDVLEAAPTPPDPEEELGFYGDWLGGGPGDDVLRSGHGNEVLFGDAGADVLIDEGGAGDLLFGDEGDDELTSSDSQDDDYVRCDVELYEPGWDQAGASDSATVDSADEVEDDCETVTVKTGTLPAG